MSDVLHLDIRLGSTDAEQVTSVEAALADLKPARREQHRDIETVLTIASSAVSVANGLVVLWRELRNRQSRLRVTVEAASGDELDLGSVEAPREIEDFIGRVR